MANPDQPRDDQGRWVSRRGPLLAAIVLLVSVGAGDLGAGSSGLGSTGISGEVGGESQTLRGESNASLRGKARDRTARRVTARLVRQSLRVREREVKADNDCAAHSYGQVQDFFRMYPCVALFRALLEVRDGRNNVALVAVTWVDMPDADQAQQLQQLMDQPGTGNVTELSRERGGQRFSGYYYRSARDGNTVANAQAEPVGTAAAVITLAKLATSAAV